MTDHNYTYGDDDETRNIPSCPEHHPDERQQDPDQLLEWLCWMRATTGERFYPPAETAAECSAAYDDDVEDDDDDDGEYSTIDEPTAHAIEYGEHCRAYTNAVMFFDDLSRAGYDPVQLAEKHVEDARADGLDLEAIDWEWLTDRGQYIDAIAPAILPADDHPFRGEDDE